MVADREAGPSAGQKTLAIALDIANWLPEIAADSDMPETPWNEVNAQSAATRGRLPGAHCGLHGSVAPGRPNKPMRKLAISKSCSTARDPRLVPGNRAGCGGTVNSIADLRKSMVHQ